MTNADKEDWDGYPAGSVVLVPSSGIILEIQGPARRRMVRAVVQQRTYSSYAQQARVIGAIHENGRQLIKSMAKYNKENGRAADACVADMGKFVFYTGEE